MATTTTFGYGRLSDLRDCYTVDLRGYDSVWESSTWARCLQDRQSATFVVRDSGKVIGLLTGSRAATFFDIHKVSVLPEHRRKGLCKRLVEGLGAGELRVQLKETNGIGLAVAKALGFRAVKVLRSAFDSEDGVLLVRGCAG